MKISGGLDFNLKEIEGRWFVNMSTFPMWLKGDKINPTFNYALRKENTLSDTVMFEKNGKQKSIRGIDKFRNQTFTWRGNGILKIAKSEWQILYFDRENRIAIIRFAKTLFTPAGYDVISRKKSLEPELEKQIRELILSMGIDELFSVIRQD